MGVYNSNFIIVLCNFVYICSINFTITSELKMDEFDTFKVDRELDFHNMGILTREEIKYLVECFLEDSILMGASNVLIVTGRGNTVRPLVRLCLMESKKVASFRIARFFRGGAGAFEVFLKP